MTAAWAVRAGRHGEREEVALREGIAVVGWPGIQDLSGIESREQLKSTLRRAYPDRSNSVIGNWAGQLWRFLRRIEVGDLLVIPLKSGHLAIGRVSGPYQYRADAPEGERHTRPVTWLRTDLPRKQVEPDLLNSLGSLLTIFGLRRHGAARRLQKLAEEGIDPGRGPSDDVDAAAVSREEFLEQAANDQDHEPPRLTIREFMAMWKAARRTDGAVARIEADLAEHGLTTVPPFTEGWIDNTIKVVRVAGGPEPAAAGEQPAAEADTETETDEMVASDLPPVSFRVGDLRSATGGVASVRVTDSVHAAVTMMLGDNYSQLAVLDGSDMVIGAVSWESIGKARLAVAEPTLAEVTTVARVVEYHEDLLSQIAQIYSVGYVFVRGSDHKTLTGIVTAADLTLQFGTISRPFVLIEEVERRLRRRVDEQVPLDSIKAAGRNPNKVESAADLTLGNYERLLAKDDNFSRLGWPLDETLFIARLSAVRKTRNELMHFSPDPLADAQLAEIEGFLNILRHVDPRP